VLHHFAEFDSARVRADGSTEFGGEEEDRDVLVDPSDACGVDLHDVDGGQL
jgi:hypothetical protein